MIEDHWVYNLLFVDSLMQPLWFRMLISFLFLNINFFLSAIFFTDDYIDQRAEFPANERVISNYINLQSINNKTNNIIFRIL